MTDQTSPQSSAVSDAAKALEALRPHNGYETTIGGNPGHFWVDVPIELRDQILAALSRSPAPADRAEIVEACASAAKIAFGPGYNTVCARVLAAIRALSEARPKAAALASRPSPERRTADAVLALLDDYANNPASATNVAAMAERIAIEVRSLTDKTNAAPSPPAGEWQWVPKEPTNAMLEAGQAQGYRETWIYLTGESMRARWQRMLAAAPSMKATERGAT